MKFSRLSLLLVVAAVAAAAEAPLSDWWSAQDLSLSGFLDARAGTRYRSDPHQDGATLEELRLQLAVDRHGELVLWQLRLDLLADDIDRAERIDLETGHGLIDLREANLQFSPADWMDVKIGRQILTWGTGNLLFINDLFPKDWRSFFSGRDTAYLKAPSDALMVSAFAGDWTLDLVYTPRFDADRYITGERFSYWQPALGRLAGKADVSGDRAPDDVFDDAEFAARISTIRSGYEVAGYFYDGFWKSPGGSDLLDRAIFPDLRVYGASARGPLATGIANVEVGYYDSVDDAGGADSRLRNSELRGLVGYSRELRPELTLGLQYYVEWLQDYAAMRRSWPAGNALPDELRQVATVNVVQLLRGQTVTLNFFAYYSPSDADAYLRGQVSWKLTDDWLVTAGANVFAGEQDQTFFGQFEANSNVYAGARYSF